ncbi:unnamed protein product [Paramecium primaurelia]|uniref:EF-hand domain-containing protein n=1 Tax=Paramecium primaurelia TaxID=5886 RepID=A0A8S1JSR1_PARPR|nr:unnamed protein product [Paramecium primaurelia]
MKQFVKLLIILGESEIDIELTRQELCAQRLFEPFTSFKRLDQNNKIKLGIKEFYEFLQDNQEIHLTKQQLDTLIKYLDYDKDGQVSYNDFIKTILPQEHPELTELAMLRSSYQIDKNVLLPSEIESLLNELLLCILTWRDSFEKVKIELLQENYNNYLDYLFQGHQQLSIQQFYKIINDIQPVKQETILSCFKYIDQNKTRFITKSDVIQNLLGIQFEQFVLQQQKQLQDNKFSSYNLSPRQTYLQISPRFTQLPKNERTISNIENILSLSTSNKNRNGKIISFKSHTQLPQLN